MLEGKISLVPTHQLIVPSTLLAPAADIRTYKATKIHMLNPLTYELVFQNSSKRETAHSLANSSAQVKIKS